MRNNCLEPRSLVMTRSECFYCFGEEGLYCGQVFYNFGIRSCDNHYKAAVRDCRAYMHREKIVHIADVLDHPFIEALKRGFSVLRSSGVQEDGWSLNVGTYDPEVLAYRDGWIISVKNGDLSKRIYVSELRTAELETAYCDFIDLLDKGIYKADSDIYESLVDRGKSTTVEDIPGLSYTIVDGIRCAYLDLTL